MLLLSTTILWTLLIFIAVTIHFQIIVRNNRNPNHAVSFLIVLSLGIWISMSIYDTWYFRAVNLLYLGLEYWMLFNLLLNFFRLKDPLYLGSKSWLDRVEKSMKSPGATLGLKFVIWAICSFILLDLPNPWE